MIDIISFFTTPWAKFIVVPIITVALGSWMKANCQSNKGRRLLRNYAYCGPDLMVTAMLLAFTDVCIKLGNNGEGDMERVKNCLNNFFLMMLSCGLLSTMMALIVRKWGWNFDDTGYPFPRWWVGIILPDVIGVVSLYLVLNLSQL